MVPKSKYKTVFVLCVFPNVCVCSELCITFDSFWYVCHSSHSSRNLHGLRWNHRWIMGSSYGQVTQPSYNHFGMSYGVQLRSPVIGPGHGNIRVGYWIQILWTCRSSLRATWARMCQRENQSCGRARYLGPRPSNWNLLRSLWDEFLAPMGWWS